MAYTDKDAVYEIAEKLGYTGDEGLTTTEAVYAVASALGYTGEHDKSVALALSDLKTVVGGGGGGGDLGVTGIVEGANGIPVVGGAPAENACIAEVRVGDQLAVSGGGASMDAYYFAAGLTLSTAATPSSEVVCAAYVVTFDGNGKYATVEEWDGTLTKRETTADGEQAWCFDFVMPELAEGEAIELFLHT